MAQTTILASGTTAATSSNIVLAAGETALVSLFSATGFFESQWARFEIKAVTPGTTLAIGALSIAEQSVQISGPGTFTVSRPLMQTAVGICADV